jgi:hypothetical protein
LIKREVKMRKWKNRRKLKRRPSWLQTPISSKKR